MDAGRDIEFFHAAPGSAEQNACLPMLAECFDEWKGEISRMPFVEESFIARSSDGRIAGHAGIMPMRIHGDGRVLCAAGIASVGVHPEFRRRGIAARLCGQAADWAAERGYDLLALYTGVNRVYEVCGWKDYPVSSLTLENPAPSGAPGKCGPELTGAERAAIAEWYDAGPVFRGKVIREQRSFFHSWEQLFRSPDLSWYTGEGGYALAYHGVLAEAGGPGLSVGLFCGMKTAFLSPEDPVVEKLLAAGWRIAARDEAHPACWGGENVMARAAAGGSIPSGLFFSLADRF